MLHTWKNAGAAVTGRNKSHRAVKGMSLRSCWLHQHVRGNSTSDKNHTSELARISYATVVAVAVAVVTVSPPPPLPNSKQPFTHRNGCLIAHLIICILLSDIQWILLVNCYGL